MLRESEGHVIEKKYIFWLLCSLQKLDYLLLNKLIHIFGNIENMYVISNSKDKFKEILIKNKLFFSKEELEKLLNSKLKVGSQLLYSNIVSKGIDIKLVKIGFKYELVIYYGKISLLKSKIKKVYCYNTNISEYGKKKLDFLENNKKIKEHINIKIKNSEEIECYTNSNEIVIYQISNLSELRSINTSKLSKENAYFFTLNYNQFLSSICDILIFVEAKYTKESAYLVDSILELGKDILVLPGDVWNKNCYFSNYLIKEGANVVLGIDDLNYYL